MKILIAYYSRTGKTRYAAQEMAKILNADIEEIKDRSRREGLFGYIRSGVEGFMRSKVRIDPPERDPASYGLLVIGTPMWAGKLSSPVRSYLSRFREGLPPIALVCTASGGNADDVALDLKRTVGVGPIAALCLSEEEADDPRTVVNLRIFLDGVVEKMKK
jgi:flavodoxin